MNGNEKRACLEEPLGAGSVRDFDIRLAFGERDPGSMPVEIDDPGVRVRRQLDARAI
ncbi:MAG TPA: hypothetical protein VIK30_02260 [Polyangia bacterium]